MPRTHIGILTPLWIWMGQIDRSDYFLEYNCVLRTIRLPFTIFECMPIGIVRQYEFRRIVAFLCYATSDSIRTLSLHYKLAVCVCCTSDRSVVVITTSRLQPSINFCPENRHAVLIYHAEIFFCLCTTIACLCQGQLFSAWSYCIQNQRECEEEHNDCAFHLRFPFVFSPSWTAVGGQTPFFPAANGRAACRARR